MSLILKQSAHVGNACRSIYLSDNTGLYSASNTGGWNNVGGSDPNILISSIIETHILITLPDGVTVVDIENPTGLPSSDTTFEYEISASVISGGTYISDGLYQIEYTVFDGTDTYTTGPQYMLFTCNVQCCIANLFAKIAKVNDCNCDSTYIKNAIYADALLQGLLANEDCGDIVSINGLLTKLNTICGNSNADCGCGN